MKLEDPLDDVFRNKSHVRILRALVTLPEGIDASTREIARRAGLTHPTASTVLECLVRQGLVRARRTMRADEYRLNDDHVIAEKLKPLFGWERRARDELKRLLATEIDTRADWIWEAYLFGSVVDGGMRPDSDVDVAVTCPPRQRQRTIRALADIGEVVRARFGNRLSPLVATRHIQELAQSGLPRFRVWQTIAKEGVPIVHGRGGIPVVAKE